MTLEVRVLGVLAIELDGRPLELGGIRQRSLVTLLVLNRNRAVTADSLADSLWPDEQPPTAIKTVQVYVSRLRRSLEAEKSRLESIGAGYAFRLGDDELDAAKFEDGILRARSEVRAGRLGNARSLLESALRLWHGEPLSDVAEFPFARLEADRLAELLWQAREELFETRLQAGDAKAVLGDLRKAVGEQPNRERLIGQLMRALYAEGRQTEALAAFHQARRYLSDELGVDPGPALQALEGAILRQELNISPTTEMYSQPQSTTPEPRVLATTYEIPPRPLDSGRFASRRAIRLTSGALALVGVVLVAILYLPGIANLGTSTSSTTVPHGSPLAAELSPSPRGVATLPRIDAQLSPGVYRTQLFSPTMTFVFGSGWRTSGDTPGAVGIGPQDDPDAQIVFVRIQTVYNGACPPAAMEIGPSPRDLIEALRQRDDLDVSEAVAVTYGEAIGLQVDLTPRTDSCGADDPPVLLFQVAQSDRFAQPGRPSRLVALDVDGQTLAADIYGPDLEAFWQRARAILESFTIDMNR